MNKRGIISYLCAAALAFALGGCTLTKDSTAPKAQAGKSNPAPSTNSNSNSSSNRVMAAKAQPQPQSPKIFTNQVAAASKPSPPVSPAASPRSVPQPQSPSVPQPEIVNRKMTLQTNVQSSDLPPDALVIRADPKTVSKEDASHSGLALTGLFKHKGFKWIMALGVLGLAYWYVRRRGGSKAGSKGSKLALSKPVTIPVTDFPTE